MKGYGFLLGAGLTFISASIFADSQSNAAHFKALAYNVKASAGVDEKFCEQFVSHFSFVNNRGNGKSKSVHHGREVIAHKYADTILKLGHNKALAMGYINENVTVNNRKEAVNTQFSYVTNMKTLESRGLWKNKYCSGAFISTLSHPDYITTAHLKKHLNLPSAYKKANG